MTRRPAKRGASSRARMSLKRRQSRIGRGRPAGIHSLSWRYMLAEREVGIAGRESMDADSSARQGWRRRVSVVFHRMLARRGVDFGVVRTRRMAVTKPWVPTIARRIEASAPALSGHVPTVIVPHGWTVEADIREELLALSELVALRKVS